MKKQYPEDFIELMEKTRAAQTKQDIALIMAKKGVPLEEAKKMAELVNPPFTEEELEKMYQQLNPIIYN